MPWKVEDAQVLVCTVDDSMQVLIEALHKAKTEKAKLKALEEQSALKKEKAHRELHSILENRQCF